MSRLDENLGTCAPDNLINCATPATDAFSVTIRKLAAAETLKRGTALAISNGTAGDGKMVILGTTGATDEKLVANCVLADDTDVGTTSDVTAIAYRTGHFNRNKLTVKAGYTMTASDEEALRSAGILLSDAFN